MLDSTVAHMLASSRSRFSTAWGRSALSCTISGHCCLCIDSSGNAPPAPAASVCRLPALYRLVLCLTLPPPPSAQVSEWGRLRRRVEAGPPRWLREDELCQLWSAVRWRVERRQVGLLASCPRSCPPLCLWQMLTLLACRPHGNGTETSPDGVSYSGQWIAGLKSGQGSSAFGCGTAFALCVLLPSWLMHCLSLRNFSSGDRYEGMHEQGRRCGYGTLTYKDDADGAWDGEWKDGDRHGRGILFRAPQDTGTTSHAKNGPCCPISTMLCFFLT